MQDERASLADQLGPQIRTEERQTKRRLEREIELVHGLEEREVGATSQALQTRLLPSGHLLGQQEREEVRVGPAFLLGLHGDLLVDAPHVRQVQTLEQSLAFRLGEAPALWTGVVGAIPHDFTSLGKKDSRLAFVPASRTSAVSGGAPPNAPNWEGR